jgi:hypothetical protein
MSLALNWVKESKRLIYREISTFLVCVRIYIQKE